MSPNQPVGCQNCDQSEHLYNLKELECLKG